LGDNATTSLAVDFSDAILLAAQTSTICSVLSNSHQAPEFSAMRSASSGGRAQQNEQLDELGLRRRIYRAVVSALSARLTPDPRWAPGASDEEISLFGARRSRLLAMAPRRFAE